MFGASGVYFSNVMCCCGGSVISLLEVHADFVALRCLLLLYCSHSFATCQVTRVLLLYVFLSWDGPAATKQKPTKTANPTNVDRRTSPFAARHCVARRSKRTRMQRRKSKRRKRRRRAWCLLARLNDPVAAGVSVCHRYVMGKGILLPN